MVVLFLSESFVWFLEFVVLCLLVVLTFVFFIGELVSVMVIVTVLDWCLVVSVRLGWMWVWKVDVVGCVFSE